MKIAGRFLVGVQAPAAATLLDSNLSDKKLHISSLFRLMGLRVADPAGKPTSVREGWIESG